MRGPPRPQAPTHYRSPLLTRILHYSDLHLGPTHDPAALNDLQLLAHKLKTNAPVFRLLVTGDVTNNGTASQFSKARGELHDLAELAGEAAYGLQTTQPGHGIVPGNHDYGALRVFSPTCQSDQFVEYFDKAPAASDRIPLGDGWSLRLLRVCSTRGATTFQQLAARGSCVRQLDALDQVLSEAGSRGAKEVRALLLHHPPSYDHLIPNGPFELDRPSRQRLERLIRDHKVSALLSGHTHVPYIEKRSVYGHAVLDAVCGSSALRSGRKAAEIAQRVLTGNHPEPLSAIVHDVQPSGDTLSWTATLYERIDGSFAVSKSQEKTKRARTIQIIL